MNFGVNSIFFFLFFESSDVRACSASCDSAKPAALVALPPSLQPAAPPPLVPPPLLCLPPSRHWATLLPALVSYD